MLILTIFITSLYISLQLSLNKAIDIILKASEGTPLWQHADMQKQQQQIEAEAALKMGEDPKGTKTQLIKPLYLQVTYVFFMTMQIYFKGL